MNLLSKIDLVIDAAEGIIKTFERQSDATGYRAGLNAGTLWAWEIILASLNDIRKLTPIPAHVGHGIECPECGAEYDLVPEPPEFALSPEGTHVWIGPTLCLNCGQALDLTALNVPGIPEDGEYHVSYSLVGDHNIEICDDHVRIYAEPQKFAEGESGKHE